MKSKKHSTSQPTGNKDRRFPVKVIEDFNWKLPFGKYKGKTLEEVIIEDHKYVIWFSENIDSIRIKPSIIHSLKLHSKYK